MALHLSWRMKPKKNVVNKIGQYKKRQLPPKQRVGPPTSLAKKLLAIDEVNFRTSAIVAT